MKRRIAALALALAFLAAPALAAVSPGGCPPCCPHMAADMGMAGAPCDMEEAPCGALAATPCCDAAPVAPPSQPHQTLDAPSPQLVGAALCPATDAGGRRGPAPGRDENLALLTSPFRLSVVLLI